MDDQRWDGTWQDRSGTLKIRDGRCLTSLTYSNNLTSCGTFSVCFKDFNV